jgi:hypothetical protein
METSGSVECAKMKAVIQLFDFPSEIMSCLTRMLSWGDLIRLGQTGSPLLTSCLQRFGAVSELQVKTGAILKPQSTTWPQLFNGFRSLTLLSFECHPKSLPGFDPLLLPPTLTEFAIGSSEWFYDNFFQCRFNVCKTLPNLRLFRIKIELSKSMADWVATWPPSLTTLDVSSFNFNFPLPSSLTSLDVSYATFENDEIHIPPNLTHLELYELKATRRFLSHLPATLDSLLWWSTYSDSNIDSVYPLLPIRLSRLLILSGESFMRHLSGIPPHLTDLEVSRIEISQISHLPSTLKRLKIGNCNGEISARDFLESLPRSLTHIEIDAPSGQSMLDLEGKTALPPGIVKFSLPWLCICDELAAQSFDLAELSYLNVSEICGSIMNLPLWPQLKVLRATKMPLLPCILQHLARHSPLLESIETYEGFALVDGFEGGEGVSSSTHVAMARFQKISTLFHLDDSMDPTFQFPRFSRHLRSICIQECEHIHDKFIIQGLASSLEFLEIPQGFFISDVGVQSLSHCINLRILNLNGSPKVTSKCFKFLPRHLENLGLSNSESIWDEDIADLPQSLSDITFNSAIHLTDACVPLLPIMTCRFYAKENRNLTPGPFKLLTNKRSILANNFEFFGDIVATSS